MMCWTVFVFWALSVPAAKRTLDNCLKQCHVTCLQRSDQKYYIIAIILGSRDTTKNCYLQKNSIYG